MINELGEAGLVTVGKVIDGLRSGTANSWADYSAPTRVEPNMIVDSSLLFYEHLSVVAQSLHSAVSAYYLLSWNMLQASVDNIAVIRHLDKLNPNRSVRNSVVDTAGAIWSISNEGYGYRLPKFGEYAIGWASNEARTPVNTVDYIANVVKRGVNDAMKERDAKDKSELGKGVKESKSKDDKGDNGLMEPGGLVSRSTEVIKEASNLAVGKILEVQISSGKNKTSLPVMIRLNASTMVPALLADFMSVGNADSTVASRILKWRTGQIDMIDLLTARDLVKEHKKNLITDSSGMYAAVAAQKRGNKLSGLLSLNPSVANSSNLIIVNAETIKKLELQINARFSDFRARQKLFDATGLFIVAVVDTDYDRIKFYTTGISMVSDLAVKDCNTANNKKDGSITDVLKAYQLGNAPSF